MLFKIENFFSVIDQINASLFERFLSHRKFYASFQYFDPRRFDGMSTRKLILDFHAIFEIFPSSLNVCKDKLNEELIAFPKTWSHLKR